MILDTGLELTPFRGCGESVRETGEPDPVPWDRGQEAGVLDVEQWAEMRRMHRAEGLSIKEIARRSGAARNTVGAALRSEAPPSYERSHRPSKLDPFKGRVEELLREDPKTPARRIQELITSEGYEGSKAILSLRSKDPYTLKLCPCGPGMTSWGDEWDSMLSVRRPI